MNQRSERLLKVIAMAEFEDQNECMEMKRVQQSLEMAVDRLQELIAHYERYQSASLPTGAVGAAQWQDFQRFLARLAQAVKYQSEQVRNAEELLETHRRRWQEKRKRVRVLEQIRRRYRRAELDRDDRQMQKALDDLQPMENLFEN